jgi:hypothetical protein
LQKELKQMNNLEFSLLYEKIQALPLAYLQSVSTQIPTIIKEIGNSLNAHIAPQHGKGVAMLKDIFTQLELNNIYISLQVLEVYINTNDITNAKKQLRQVETISVKATEIIVEYIKKKN